MMLSVIFETEAPASVVEGSDPTPINDTFYNFHIFVEEPSKRV